MIVITTFQNLIITAKQEKVKARGLQNLVILVLWLFSKYWVVMEHFLLFKKTSLRVVVQTLPGCSKTTLKSANSNIGTQCPVQNRGKIPPIYKVFFWWPLLAPSKICELILRLCNTEIVREHFKITQSWPILWKIYILHGYWHTRWNLELFQSRQFPDNTSFSQKWQSQWNRTLSRSRLNFWQPWKLWKKMFAQVKNAMAQIEMGLKPQLRRKMEKPQLSIGWSETVFISRSSKLFF